jgi:hypothetical protein
MGMISMVIGLGVVLGVVLAPGLGGLSGLLLQAEKCGRVTREHQVRRHAGRRAAEKMLGNAAGRSLGTRVFQFVTQATNEFVTQIVGDVHRNERARARARRARICISSSAKDNYANRPRPLPPSLAHSLSALAARMQPRGADC